MRIEITAHPRYWIQLSLPHIKLLMKLSRLHHDPECQLVGQVNGFLHTWNKMLGECKNVPVALDGTCLNTSGTPQLVSATFNELDMILKVLEFPPPCMEAKDRAMRDDMFRSIIDAIVMANAELRQIQLVKE